MRITFGVPVVLAVFLALSAVGCGGSGDAEPFRTSPLGTFFGTGTGYQFSFNADGTYTVEHASDSFDGRYFAVSGTFTYDFFRNFTDVGHSYSYGRISMTVDAINEGGLDVNWLSVSGDPAPEFYLGDELFGWWLFDEFAQFDAMQISLNRSIEPLDPFSAAEWVFYGDP